MYYRVASRVYDIYGPVYDMFGFLFKKRLAAALEAIPFHENDHVLDIGVGTGFSLAHYPAYVRVTGIDQSEGMLEQARRKVFRREVRMSAPATHTRLIQADALCLPFPNEHFAVIVLSHVIGTVSNPHHCLREAARVAKERAYIVLVNHFASRGAILGFVEELLDPICRRLGWRAAVPLDALLERLGVQDAGLAAGAQKDYVSTIYLQKTATGLRMLPAPLLTAEKMDVSAMPA